MHFPKRLSFSAPQLYIAHTHRHKQLAAAWEELDAADGVLTHLLCFHLKLCAVLQDDDAVEHHECFSAAVVAHKHTRSAVRRDIECDD